MPFGDTEFVESKLKLFTAVTSFEAASRVAALHFLLH